MKPIANETKTVKIIYQKNAEELQAKMLNWSKKIKNGENLNGYHNSAQSQSKFKSNIELYCFYFHYANLEQLSGKIKDN